MFADQTLFIHTMWNNDRSNMWVPNRFYLFLVLYLNCAIQGHCFVPINPSNVIHRDVSSIFIREIKFPKGAHQNVLPSSFTATLTVRGQEVNLSLHHNAELQYIPTPIVALQKRWNGGVMRNKYVHYQDKSKLAAVEVECHDVGCTSISLFGTLFIDGELILIQKQQSNGGSSSVIYDVIHSSTNHIYHGNDYAIPPNQNKVDNTPRANKSVLDRRKRASGTYTLELLLVIDYSFYKYWYDKQSTSSNQATRRAAAINDIRRYCGFFMNGLDLRYDVMTGGSYTINVVFAGIYIMETLQSSPFNKAEGLIDAETALNSFSEWMNSNSGTLPAHDHAMIITSLDLFRSGSTATKGYAFLGTMCSSNSHSVVEDDFDFLSQTTAAHEIGHGLNAVHDGDSNSCLVSAGYIMAASSQVFPPSDSRRFNLWKFSTCSVNEIGAFIDTLNPNCLLRNDVTDTSGLDAYTATPIGQIYSPDTQCIYSYGTGSYFGRSFYNESTLSALCTSMYCRDPTTTNSYYIMVPGYGTSCGNNKWCDGGQCVTAAQAPTLSATCPFGDSPGIVYDGKTCSVYIRDNPWRCYSDSVYRTCCSSCDAIRTTISGCEFGDKTDCSTITSGSGCYAGSNADVCCGTCQQYKTGISDCMYGDRADCSSVSSQRCYQNEELCCLHCFQYQTGIPNCKFGDRFTQCSSNLCNQIPTACCGTCYTGTTFSPSLPTTTTTTKRSTTTLPTTLPTTVRSSAGTPTAAPTTVSVQSTTSSTTAAQSTTLPSTVLQSTLSSTTRAQPTILSSTVIQSTTRAPSSTLASTLFLSTPSSTTRAQSTDVTINNLTSTISQSTRTVSTESPSTKSQSATSHISSIIPSTTTDLPVAFDLGDWIVPVASIVGGIIILIIAITLFVCFMKRRKTIKRRRSSRRSRTGIDGPFIIEERSANLAYSPYKVQNGAQPHTPYLVQNGSRHNESEIIHKVAKPSRPPPPRPVRSPSQKGYGNNPLHPSL